MRSPDVASTKLAAMKAGETVVTNDDELDEMLKLMDASGDADYMRIRTIRNPRRVGIKDQYQAWINAKPIG